MLVSKRNGVPTVTVLSFAGTLADGHHQQGLVTTKGFGHLHKAGRRALYSLTIHVFITREFNRSSPNSSHPISPKDMPIITYPSHHKRRCPPVSVVGCGICLIASCFNDEGGARQDDQSWSPVGGRAVGHQSTVAQLPGLLLLRSWSEE